MEQTNQTLPKTFFKNCPSINELKKYAQNNLSTLQEDTVEEFLNHCDHKLCECANFIEGLQLEIIAQKIASEEPELTQDFDAKILYQKLKPTFELAKRKVKQKARAKQVKFKPYHFAVGLAATVSLVVLVYIAYNTFFPNLIQQKKNSIAQDSTPLTTPPTKINIEKNESSNSSTTEPTKSSSEKQKSPNLFSENIIAYAENTDLEDFIAMNKRGEKQNQKISPENNAVFLDEVMLDWSATDWKIQEIEVVDNQNNSIFKATPSTESKHFPLNISEWKNGLYYWKLIDNNRMAYLGKFIKKSEK